MLLLTSYSRKAQNSEQSLEIFNLSDRHHKSKHAIPTLNLLSDQIKSQILKTVGSLKQLLNLLLQIED